MLYVIKFYKYYFTISYNLFILFFLEGNKYHRSINHQHSSQQKLVQVKEGSYHPYQKKINPSPKTEEKGFAKKCRKSPSSVAAARTTLCAIE